MSCTSDQGSKEKNEIPGEEPMDEEYHALKFDVIA